MAEPPAGAGPFGAHRWRGAGIAGAVVGVLAAAAVAGAVVERLTAERTGRREEARRAPDGSDTYGTLRGAPGRAVADDGTELHYEIDEIEDAGQHPARAADPRHRPLRGRPVTVVFCHGFCLNQDSWHFQRAALRGLVRAVYWDQRSHGRSERGAAQRAGAPVTIDQLGRDLKAVLDAAVPDGPVVLVGHSMGGMTVMALAAHYPDYVRRRVLGAALVGTSAGDLGQVNYGLPVAGVNALRRLLPGVFKLLGSRAAVLERGRRMTADLFAGLIKHYSFSARDVDPAVARFAERMIESTRIEVAAEFYPAFQEHDKTGELGALAGLPVLVLAGELDLVTPSDHGAAIVGLLTGAELVLVPDAGHLVMLERPETVTAQLLELLVRATQYEGFRDRRAGNG
ncbi:alpha/beta fold hydrolase [Streptomyces sp. TP-A0874]|uniref:alpha/beta fold hydrolase n=1 Tax=Streptomyces sp. TP-A0874 TaxID=549819 RepID=UPI0008531177|nr:alpha/beta hydrolase [Streptomyces sp. TP-A0874]